MLGMKCSYRNLNVSSSLLCWYNFLVVTAFLIFYVLLAQADGPLNPVQVFLFFIVSLVVWAWLQIASVQRQHFLWLSLLYPCTPKSKTLWTMSLFFFFSVALLDSGSLLVFNCIALVESLECFFVLQPYRIPIHCSCSNRPHCRNLECFCLRFDVWIIHAIMPLW